MRNGGALVSNMFWTVARTAFQALGSCSFDLCSLNTRLSFIVSQSVGPESLSVGRINILAVVEKKGGSSIRRGRQ